MKRKFNEIERERTVEEIAIELLQTVSTEAIVKILPSEVPPANMNCSIYILCIDQQTIYVGETVSLSKRLEQHRTIADRKNALCFASTATNKSDGLKKEAILLSSKIPWINIACVSDQDGFHKEVLIN